MNSGKIWKMALALCLTISGVQATVAPAAKFTLPPLPYEKNALEPYISQKTLDFHYGKHHQGYVDKLNELMVDKKLKAGSLEEVIVLSSKDPSLTPIFNSAAQTWNHTFYWQSMKKDGGGKPTGKMLDKITKQFGSYDEFKKQFIDAGTKLFGSGWVWLVQDGDTLKIVATGNADLPLIHKQKALLTCDVWEHAYYLDYQNRRKDYVEIFLDHLVNWEFANRNLG